MSKFTFTEVAIIICFALVLCLMASPVKAEDQQWENPIENNPLMENLRANQLLQIEQQKLQIMQEQDMRQDLQRIQEQQYMINQQSNRLIYE